MASIWALGAGLTQPLFHGGELQARRRAASAASGAAHWAYQQTVLEGLQQVADALRVLEQDAVELAAREQTRQDAASAAEIARKRLQAGGISEQAALDAQAQALQAKLDRTRAQAQRLLDSAALFQALGAPVGAAK
jgi:outer membrane protein TolC